jgi:hypothetical protein
MKRRRLDLLSSLTMCGVVSVDFSSQFTRVPPKGPMIHTTLFYSQSLAVIIVGHYKIFR